MKENKEYIKDRNSLEKRILEQSATYVVPDGKEKEKVWEELLLKLDNTQNISHNHSLNVFYKIAVAAIVLIISSIAFLYSDTKITTNFAETQEVYLPDSSFVFLQAGSSIVFNEKWWHSKREIRLKGEAYFSVKKGSNFTVQTKEGSVQVLGTKFNVISRKAYFNVACVSGKVRVSLDNSNKVVLTKGLCTEKLKNGQLAIASKMDIEQTIKRNKGEFYFEKTDLKLVFDELERQFDVEIEYSNIKNRQFTGYFSNKDLETALKMVCKPMELEYTVNNRLITIKN